jgi:hypothetical protein
LEYDSTDGVRIRGWLLTPQHQPPRLGLILGHGIERLASFPEIELILHGQPLSGLRPWTFESRSAISALKQRKEPRAP